MSSQSTWTQDCANRDPPHAGGVSSNPAAMRKKYRGEINTGLNLRKTVWLAVGDVGEHSGTSNCQTCSSVRGSSQRLVRYGDNWIHCHVSVIFQYPLLRLFPQSKWDVFLAHSLTIFYLPFFSFSCYFPPPPPILENYPQGSEYIMLIWITDPSLPSYVTGQMTVTTDYNSTHFTRLLKGLSNNMHIKYHIELLALHSLQISNSHPTSSWSLLW